MRRWQGSWKQTVKESLNVSTRSTVWCWYRGMRVSSRGSGEEEKKRGGKERVETARWGTGCSRHHLKRFKWSERRTNNVKVWEILGTVLNGFQHQPPAKIVFSLTWDFQHWSSDSRTAKSTGPPFPLNPSPKLSLSWLNNITQLIAIAAVLLRSDLAGGQNW